MPANLKDPFGASCCDGGECNISKMSAQPCGCDKGCRPKPYVCERHRMEAAVRAEMEAAEQFYKDSLNR